MNTFSRLSLFMLVCLGFALMFVGNTADAQVYELRVSGVTGTLYQIGATPTITYTLLDAATLAAQAGVTVELTPHDVTILTTNRVTNADGQLQIRVRINQTTDATLTAVPQPLARYSVEVKTYLGQVPPRTEKPVIVVLPPDPKTMVTVGDTFTQTIGIRDVADLSAWQMDVVFNPAILKVTKVAEGGFLQSGGYNAFFQSSSVADSNAAGRIRLSQARIGRKPNASPPPSNVLTKPSPSGVSIKKGSGEGELVTLTFEVLEFAEEPLGIHNVQLSNSKNERISYSVLVTDLLVVTHQFPAEDVNRDGNVNVQDLVMVANDMGARNSNLGRANPINPRTDVNNDGFVNVLDLIKVSSYSSWASAVTLKDVRSSNKASLAAPSANVEALTSTTIQGWIDLAQVEDDGSAVFEGGIANLKSLLVSRKPSETRLLLNYPNPFNPETWIPYQLSEATDVRVTIHSMNGSLIRTLELGHQAVGVYQSKSQAAYWDGRNEFGEQVASGLYFYTLTAGNFNATGKMLVRK